jgi:uncharacterized membrane protein
MAFCTVCGAQTPDGSTICPACSRSGAPAARPVAAPVGGLADNVAALLCYSPVGLIADIVFLVAEPYNRNRFIRFHAFQSLFTALAVFVLAIALVIVGMLLAIIPVVGWIADMLLWAAFAIGNLVLWVMMMIKAYQNETFKLPFVGDLAEKQANA